MAFFYSLCRQARTFWDIVHLRIDYMQTTQEHWDEDSAKDLREWIEWVKQRVYELEAEDEETD